MRIHAALLIASIPEAGNEGFNSYVARYRPECFATESLQGMRALAFVMRDLPDLIGAAPDFDRTLTQLERFQRMRLGQPVLPKVEYSIPWPEDTQTTKGPENCTLSPTQKVASRCVESKTTKRTRLSTLARTR